MYPWVFCVDPHAGTHTRGSVPVLRPVFALRVRGIPWVWVRVAHLRPSLRCPVTIRLIFTSVRKTSEHLMQLTLAIITHGSHTTSDTLRTMSKLGSATLYLRLRAWADFFILPPSVMSLSSSSSTGYSLPRRCCRCFTYFLCHR